MASTAADQIRAKFVPVEPGQELLAEARAALATTDDPVERDAIRGAALEAAVVVAHEADDDVLRVSLVDAIEALAHPETLDSYHAAGTGRTASELATADPDGFGKVLAAVRAAAATDKAEVLAAGMGARDWDAEALELLGAVSMFEVNGGEPFEVAPRDEAAYFEAQVAGMDDEETLAEIGVTRGEPGSLRAALEAWMTGDNEGTFSDGDQAQ